MARSCYVLFWSATGISDSCWGSFHEFHFDCNPVGMSDQSTTMIKDK